ncbi:MAG: hypothetical protein IPM79_27655 [Polyangiaceae bacterium]|nr:hypothetical protein [Polyangiaceae bacterium]MBK8941282.1 hypothetical protein [Polyangiaceae bacterium]
MAWPIWQGNTSFAGSGLPAFRGPDAPHPTFMLAIEAGVLFGGGAR